MNNLNYCTGNDTIDKCYQSDDTWYVAFSESRKQLPVLRQLILLCNNKEYCVQIILQLYFNTRNASHTKNDSAVLSAEYCEEWIRKLDAGKLFIISAASKNKQN